MVRLDWGRDFVFNNENEYYETLGFLCKDVEVIKIYIEDNRKAGARGIQGRLRVVEGNYKSFPRPLNSLFENSNDKPPSVTDYVRNLIDNHSFKKEVDPTGKGYTTWFYKTSLNDVKKTIPQKYHNDFMRGYLWDYKINTRILNKEYLSDNAKNKYLTDINEAKDSILNQNKIIAINKDSQKRTAKYDVFLSHSSLDKGDILSLVDLFVNAGYAVYVDWIEDEELDRTEVTPKTAQLLKKRMNSSQGLAYIASTNTAQSKWCPWELGYFDGKKSKRCCILPIMEAGNFVGQEYLGLYPYLRYGQEEDTSKADFWVYDQETDKHITLRSWLDGAKLT